MIQWATMLLHEKNENVSGCDFAANNFEYLLLWNMSIWIISTIEIRTTDLYETSRVIAFELSGKELRAWAGKID